VSLEVWRNERNVEVSPGSNCDHRRHYGHRAWIELLSQCPTLSRYATSVLRFTTMAISRLQRAWRAATETLAAYQLQGRALIKNTFMIDGVDSTSNMDGVGGDNSGFVPTPALLWFPLPGEHRRFSRGRRTTRAPDSRAHRARVNVTKRHE